MILYSESDLLPLSGLQHLVFCERQCALIHVERVWRENVLTAEGRVLHERTDSGEMEGRGDLRVARGIPLRSLRLGLAGRADVVELHRVYGPGGTAVSGLEGCWQPFPVEYKRGTSKWIDCDRVQLCAQALCLEEMLGVQIPSGALFYGQTRRREEVQLDERLRLATEEAAARFHEIVAGGLTPMAYRAPKCKSCSLLEICMPPRRRRASVSRYLAAAIERSDE
ncbi:MAG TPA: CRISPR-associated protein Cas4 [Thermoanaerobaculia bacterium]|nr:CRISPR-associated protein Cas4 [Thermoanaerobaculia bacterium]